MSENFRNIVECMLWKVKGDDECEPIYIFYKNYSKSIHRYKERLQRQDENNINEENT